MTVQAKKEIVQCNQASTIMSPKQIVPGKLTPRSRLVPAENEAEGREEVVAHITHPLDSMPGVLLGCLLLMARRNQRNR